MVEEDTMSPQTSRRSRSRLRTVIGSPRCLGPLVVAMLFAAWVSMPASALAEECGDTTIAYGSLNWEEGSEWSDGHPPTESEIACIPNTVSRMRIISNATAKALRDEATPLWIEGSSTLDLTGASTDSSIYKLGMYKGTLAISGYLSITHEMVLSEFSTNEIEVTAKLRPAKMWCRNSKGPQRLRKANSSTKERSHSARIF
jgi:hypothetical protein